MGVYEKQGSRKEGVKETLRLTRTFITWYVGFNLKARKKHHTFEHAGKDTASATSTIYIYSLTWFHLFLVF